MIRRRTQDSETTYFGFFHLDQEQPHIVLIFKQLQIHINREVNNYYNNDQKLINWMFKIKNAS